MRLDPCIVDIVSQAQEKLVGGPHPIYFLKTATICQIVAVLQVVYNELKQITMEALWQKL